MTSLAVILVICAFILMGLRAFMPQRLGSLSSLGGSYAEGYKAARERYAEVCPGFGPAATFSGTVVGVSGNKLTVHQESLAIDPRVDDVSDDRVVIMSTSGTITKLDVSSPPPAPKVVNGELVFTAPKQTTLKLQDLKPGDRVTVTSDVDIRFQEEIVAFSIQVQ